VIGQIGAGVSTLQRSGSVIARSRLSGVTSHGLNELPPRRGSEEAPTFTISARAAVAGRRLGSRAEATIPPVVAQQRRHRLCPTAVRDAATEGQVLVLGTGWMAWKAT